VAVCAEWRSRLQLAADQLMDHNLTIATIIYLHCTLLFSTVHCARTWSCIHSLPTAHLLHCCIGTLLLQWCIGTFPLHWYFPAALVLSRCSALVLTAPHCRLNLSDARSGNTQHCTPLFNFYHLHIFVCYQISWSSFSLWLNLWPAVHIFNHLSCCCFYQWTILNARMQSTELRGP